MPKLHQIGPKRFVQYTKFPYKWGFKLFTRGWTQEIEPPFRTSSPVIVRLPRYKALVFGKWTGAQKDEETALSNALSRRDLEYEDFTEEKGWIPATDENPEESLEDFYARFNTMGGTLNVYYREIIERMAED